MEKVRLGDVCDFQGGAQPPKDEWSFEQKDGYIRMLQIRDFTQTRNVEKEYIKLTSSTKTCEADDILIARYGASVGKILTGLSGAYNVAIMKTIPNERLLNKSYLKYYLLSDYFQKRINSVGERAAQAGFNKEDLSKLLVSLVSLEEQKRIADELDKVSNLIDKRKQQLSKLDELVKARFVELFENRNYPVVRLGDVCTKITDGTHKTPTYLESGITFISAKNIVNGELDFSDIKHISEQEYAEIQKRCQTEIGDILLSKSGSLGSPVIVKTTQKLGLFESLAVIKYDRDRLLPEFLCEQLKTDRVQRQFKVGTKGVAIKHLHLGVIADTGIIVPPIEKQNQFTIFVKQTDKSKLEVQKSLEKLELLKKALMQKYFG